MGNPSSAAASAAKGPSLRTGARDNIFVFGVGPLFVAPLIRFLVSATYNNQAISLARLPEASAIGLTNMAIIGQLGIVGFSSIWKRGWS